MAQNEVDHHFLEFGSYVFLEIAYNNSLRQRLMSSRGKSHEKNFENLNYGQMGQNWAENFVPYHFLKFGSLAFL